MGEVLALRWLNVDLDAGRLEVVATSQRVRGSSVFCEPKTTQSRRNVRLSATATASLRSHKGRQAEERLRTVAWEDGDVVFPDEVGASLRRIPSAAGVFGGARSRKGQPDPLPRSSPHCGKPPDGRESAREDRERDARPRSDRDMLDLYSHVTPTMQEEATAVMDGIVSGR